MFITLCGSVGNTMAFWLPLLLLLGNKGALCVLVSTPGGSHPQDLQPIAGPAAYSNDWALQVEGGDEAADVLASLTGFINMGQVSRYRESLKAARANFFSHFRLGILKVTTTFSSMRLCMGMRLSLHPVPLDRCLRCHARLTSPQLCNNTKMYALIVASYKTTKYSVFYPPHSVFYPPRACAARGNAIGSGVGMYVCIAMYLCTKNF